MYRKTGLASWYVRSVGRPVIAAMIALVFYTIVDILIWDRVFEDDPGMQWAADAYHRGWLFMLIGYVVVGAFLMLPRLQEMALYGTTLLLLGLNGTEDVLYYVLDRDPLPAALPWLDDNRLILFKPVTGDNLVLSCAIEATALGVVVLLVSLAAMALPRLTRRHLPGGPLSETEGLGG